MVGLLKKVSFLRVISDNLPNLDECLRVGYHLNQHPVVPGHREVDLSVEELHYASDLLSNTTHEPMEETNYICIGILQSLNILFSFAMFEFIIT